MGAGPQRNIRLTIEYCGARFAGWQRQPGQRTVQQCLEDAVAAVTGEKVALRASGRTDAGVHAEGQVASFRTTSGLEPERFVGAINAHLDKDVAVLDAAEVPLDFHPTRDAKFKTYRYTISMRAVRPVHDRDYVAWVPGPLDAAAMREAAGLLVGTHDFNSFRAEGRIEKDTVRAIEAIEFDESGETLRIYITGSGFLYMMVRIIVGTLIEVGWGKRSPDDMPGILAARDRGAAGHTARPEGLCLVEVRY